MVKENGQILSNTFLKKYSSALRKLGNIFKTEKPDYIIALSRKGPRLLELFRLLGIYLGNVPVITEKAIDFMPPEKLNGKKLLVFDDIIISGTTLRLIFYSCK